MHFSYDISGNVKTLTRDYPNWSLGGQRYKRVDYNYEFISTRVNMLQSRLSEINGGAAFIKEDAITVNLQQVEGGLSFEVPVKVGFQQQFVLNLNELELMRELSISFTPTAVIIRLLFTRSMKLKVNICCRWKWEMVQEQVLVDICSDDKDPYRFGYAAGEKDNEIMGIGNYVDYGEKELDTRLARLNWRPDLLAAKFPYQSSYVYAGNSPILNIDKNGEFKYPKGKEGDEYRRTFPMITLYLANYIENDVNKSSMLTKGIIKHANNPEFGRNELSSILTWGDNSRTKITFSKTLQWNANTVNSKNITVGWDYAKAVEDVLSSSKTSPQQKQHAITAFFITMMDETTLAGQKYRKDPIMSEGGNDGDVGNDLTDEVFYKKGEEKGFNRLYQADKDNLGDTKEIIKTIEDEGKSEVLPTTPKK